MSNYDVLVLGGLFPEEIEKEIIEKTIYGIQYASNAHMRMIVNGLDEALGEPVNILNMLPVGSYPKRYKDLFIKEFKFSHKEGAKDINAGFLNLTIIKKLSRLISVKHHIKKWLKKDEGKEKVLIIYTVVGEYLSAAKMVKRLMPKVHINLIVPDLPEFTDLDKKSSPIIKLSANYRTYNARKKIKFIDSFVFLTEAMNDYFNAKKPYIVMEGIAKNEEQIVHDFKSDLKYITYTGTFTRKFGVMDLVEAFSLIEGENYRLVLCGSGETEKEIIEFAKKDNRIIYKGSLLREEIAAIQSEATLLVNPRKNNEVYTKYSFPSKIMEYMASGRPTICFKLSGIPDEYDDYLSYFSGETPKEMADDIVRLCEKSDEELDKIGESNREFAINNKSELVQAKKMVEMITESMQKKKILIASYPLEAGGTTTGLISLLHNIDPQKYEVDLLLLKKKGEFLDSVPAYVNVLDSAIYDRQKIYKLFMYTIKGVFLKLVCYKLFRRKKYPLGSSFQIMSGEAWCSISKKINKRYDIAIGYMEGWPNTYIFKKVNAKKKIAWIHPEYKNSGLDPYLDRKMFNVVDNIALVSDECKKSFDLFIPEFAEKTVVIENILSKEYVINRSNEEVLDFSPDEDCFNIITVARLRNVDKGIDRAVKVLAMLKKDGYNVKWYLIGDGEDRKLIEEMIIENKLENEFILLGGRKNPYPYIKMADLFVLPSRYEGKPMAVTEAQILAVPVIATNYQSASGQIRTGVDGIVTENETDAIYKAIKSVLDNRAMLDEFRNNLKIGSFENKSAIENFYKLIN